MHLFQPPPHCWTLQWFHGHHMMKKHDKLVPCQDVIVWQVLPLLIGDTWRPNVLCPWATSSITNVGWSFACESRASRLYRFLKACIHLCLHHARPHFCVCVIVQCVDEALIFNNHVHGICRKIFVCAHMRDGNVISKWKNNGGISSKEKKGGTREK